MHSQGVGMNLKPETIIKSRTLPLTSKILVEEGRRIEPDTVIGKYILPMPRQFFLSAFSVLTGGLPDNYIPEWHIKPGDNVTYGTPIVTFRRDPGAPEFTPGRRKVKYPETEFYKSPIEGTVEEIIPQSGNIIMNEFIDYAQKDVWADIFEITGLKGRRLGRMLKVKLDDFVEKGQNLVKPAGSTPTSSAKAPLAGLITEIDLKKGRVYISRRFRTVEIKAGFHGVISRVQGTSITIESRGIRVFGICGLGGESSGELHVAAKSNETQIRADGISRYQQGKILVSGSFIGIDALLRAKEVGAAGIITGGADHLELSDFLGKEFSITATGHEELPFPIIITEGFGENPMNDDMFKFFEQNNGKPVYINGKTHIRAGVIRPEIIVQA